MNAENESIIMFAHSLARISIMCFAFALGLPLLASSAMINVASNYLTWFVIISGAGWLFAGLVLYALGMRVLGGLK